MKGNKLTWFVRVESRNNVEIVENVGVKLEQRGRPMEQWVEIIWEHMRAWRVDEVMVRDREGQRREIQIANLIYVGFRDDAKTEKKNML